MPSANSHKALIVPQSSSDIQVMVETMRSHHRAMRGDISDICAALRNVFPDIIRDRGGARMGADAKFKAARILRPWMDAAALNDDVARLYVLGYTRYDTLLVHAKGAAPKSSFNADV
jgi:hypothetical protein